MTDPDELRALAKAVASAMHAINADDPGNHGPIIPPTAVPWMSVIIAPYAADFFAARLERADRIETAARTVVAQHRAGPATEYHTPCALCARTWPCATHEALRAALEGP